MKKLPFFLLVYTCLWGDNMPAIKIVAPQDPILIQVAKEVPVDKIQSSEVQEIINQMLQIASGEREDMEKKVMVGLAAPQVGIDQRIILVDTGVTRERKELGHLNVYINPKIIWKSDEIEKGYEGCYSVPGELIGVVPRYSKIKISAYDRNGNAIEEELSGFTARIFQHEVDHLDGLRFPDRIQEENDLHIVKDEDLEQYRKNHENWPHTCPKKMWDDIKEGKPFTEPDLQLEQIEKN